MASSRRCSSERNWLMSTTISPIRSSGEESARSTSMSPAMPLVRPTAVTSRLLRSRRSRLRWTMPRIARHRCGRAACPAWRFAPSATLVALAATVAAPVGVAAAGGGGVACAPPALARRAARRPLRRGRLPAKTRCRRPRRTRPAGRRRLRLSLCHGPFPGRAAHIGAARRGPFSISTPGAAQRFQIGRVATIVPVERIVPG